ncbi:MAG: SGNH/GDSL hydrolase family protein [Spirochaetota bacterium]
MTLTDAMFSRAYIAPGNRARIDRFCERAERGESLVVGAIGGSITEGASATAPERRYIDRIAARLSERFPSAQFTIANAGIGASNSLFGAFRVRKDLFSREPDIIFIDYAVNDATNPDVVHPYESLIHACLSAPKGPPVILLFMLTDNGANRQDLQIPIGRHYDLPMLSVRDAVWPEIEQGALRWSDYSPDTVHPNDAGHDMIADMALRAMVSDGKTAKVAPLPERLNAASAQFDNGSIIDANVMKVLKNNGWKKGPHKAGYTGFQSDTPGSEFTAAVEGSYIAIGYKQYRGDFGIIEVIVDEGSPIILDGYFVQERIIAWAGGHTVIAVLTADAPRGGHTIRVRLTERRHEKSGGHQFDVGYFLVS